VGPRASGRPQGARPSGERGSQGAGEPPGGHERAAGRERATDMDTSHYTALKLGRRSGTGREKRVTPEFGE
jgi:hypothetical protein